MEKHSFERCRSRLRSLRELAPNWDTYGGGPVSPLAVDAAEAFVLRVGLGVDVWWAYPTGDGGVQIEWEDANGDYLEFEFAPDGSVSGYFNDCHATEARFAEKAASAAGVGE